MERFWLRRDFPQDPGSDIIVEWGALVLRRRHGARGVTFRDIGDCEGVRRVPTVAGNTSIAV